MCSCGGSRPPGPASCTAQGCPKNDLKNACDEISPKCPSCKAEAELMIQAMQKAWEFNYGKGNNVSRDNVGGYLCWDWSKAFLEAAQSVNPQCWTVSDAMVHKSGSLVVHFFVELKARGGSEAGGLRYFDDGWFDGTMIHNPPWPPPAGWPRGSWTPPSSKYSQPPIKGVP
jgi:hypothetical protein